MNTCGIETIEDSINTGFYVMLNSVVKKSSISKREQTQLCVCFILDETYNKINLNWQLNCNSLDQNYFKVTTNVFVPSFLLKMNRKIRYYYYLNDIIKETTTIETLVTELKRTRLLDLFALVSNDLSSGTRRNYYQFDGVAIFDNQTCQNKAKLFELKTKIIIDILQLELMRRDGFQEFYSEFLETIIRAYECLCINDYEYKLIFKNVSIQMHIN